MASRARTDRRAVLGGLAAASFAKPALAALDHVSFKVPDGACDCHHHVYDPRWAYAPTAVIKPPDTACTIAPAAPTPWSDTTPVNLP